MNKLYFARTVAQKRVRRAAGMLAASLALSLLAPPAAQAHRSGCHRWHSCPSDSGSYVCGDLGYRSECPDAKPVRKTRVKSTHTRSSVIAAEGGTHKRAAPSKRRETVTLAKATPTVTTVDSPFDLQDAHPRAAEVVVPEVVAEPTEKPVEQAAVR